MTASRSSTSAACWSSTRLRPRSWADRRRRWSAASSGADRALKRLRVTPIEEECLEHPPTVSPDASVADARTAIAKWDAGWVAVVGADGVLHGYVDDEHAVGDGEVAERLQRIETWVPIDHDLQDTLATMLLTHEGWVSVLDGDRFVGVLTPEAVYQTLRRSLEQPPDEGR